MFCDQTVLRIHQHMCTHLFYNTKTGIHKEVKLNFNIQYFVCKKTQIDACISALVNQNSTDWFIDNISNIPIFFLWWSALFNQSSSLSKCPLSVQCRIYINPTLNIFAIHVWKNYITLNIIFYVICLFCFKSLTCNFKTSQIKLKDFIYCEVFFVIFYKLYFVINIFFPRVQESQIHLKSLYPREI